MTDSEAPEPGAAISVDQLAGIFDAAEQGLKEPEPKKAEEPKGEGEVRDADESDTATAEDEGEALEESEELPEETEDETDKDGEPFLEFEAGGKDISYTREEAINYLKKYYGHSQRADRVAKREAELEQQFHSITEKQQQYASAAGQLLEFLGQQQEQYANVDWDKLVEEDPAEFQRLRYLKEKNDQLTHQAETERDKTFKELVNHNMGKEAEKLSKVMPDLIKPENADRLGKYLATCFTQGELQKLNEVPVHHQIFIAFEKARKFDAMQVKAREAVKEIKKAPTKLAKQGASKPLGQGDALTAARARTMKTHSLGDLTRLFETMEQR